MCETLVHGLRIVTHGLEMELVSRRGTALIVRSADGNSTKSNTGTHR